MQSGPEHERPRFATQATVFWMMRTEKYGYPVSARRANDATELDVDLVQILNAQYPPGDSRLVGTHGHLDTSTL
ncbi:MAG: hypothetical protein O3A63_02585 [Proteobacteria bacterium]|nr:hypothetical protein [Pseudomonadota bacterium]